jgi:streptogramin lyase
VTPRRALPVYEVVTTRWLPFCECLPDKNGEIWAGRFVRFNPKTDRWTEYVLPEPVSYGRRTRIDNSTDPVTVWYGFSRWSSAWAKYDGSSDARLTS